jgi:hypothetical protein
LYPLIVSQAKPEKFTQRSTKMKKTILIVALVVLALGALGVGAAFAQGPVPGGRGSTAQDGGGYLHTYLVSAFAQKLGLEVDDVNAQLAAGKTMYDIAIADGVKAEDFPALLSDVHAKALDAAVKDGVVTQAQADWMKSRGFGQGGMYGNGTGTCTMGGASFGPRSGSGGMGMGRGFGRQNQQTTP